MRLRLPAQPTASDLRKEFLRLRRVYRDPAAPLSTKAVAAMLTTRVGAIAKAQLTEPTDPHSADGFRGGRQR